MLVLDKIVHLFFVYHVFDKYKWFAYLSIIIGDSLTIVLSDSLLSSFTSANANELNNNIICLWILRG